MLARRNGEHSMRTINALRECDQQLAGETAEVVVRRAGAGHRMAALIIALLSDAHPLALAPVQMISAYPSLMSTPVGSPLWREVTHFNSS